MLKDKIEKIEKEENKRNEIEDLWDRVFIIEHKIDAIVEHLDDGGNEE